MLDHVIADGRWHRVKTADKPRKKNGAYLFDGQRGVARNWATMTDYAVYKDETSSRISIADYREQIRRSNAERAMRHQAAAKLADRMLGNAVVGLHPYLDRKGFPKEVGFVLDGELLVPMRDIRNYRLLTGLQRIDADGRKMFLSGSRAQESIFKIGSGEARERWLCEGFATGLSLYAALRDLRRQAQVIVCFSAGNILAVSKLVKRPAFVFADNDASGTGQKVAEDSGLPWVMPEEVGDANDVHAAKGLRAVVQLLLKRQSAPRQG
jgi:putative DNA primase/helicase